MRLAIAGFGLESVTFLPEVTDIADFERLAKRGDAVVAELRGSNTAAGGMIAAAEAGGAELTGLVYVDAGAAASASDAAYEQYTREIVEGLTGLKGRIDGLLLHLHGALATPTERRADAGVLKAIRAAMGPGFPVGVAMDLHGNLGPEVIRHATAIAGYHHSPHTDMGRTGQRAARMLIRALRGEVRPVMAIAKPGIMLPSIFTATALEPLAGLMREARAIEAGEDKVLDITVFCGFAYADVPDCGMSIVVVTDDDPALADRIARELSDRAWSLRHDLLKRELVHSIASGVDRALKAAETATKPVCLLEHADRLNDSTWVLRELIRRGVSGVMAPFMFDPESAERCIAAGQGATVDLDLCGKSSDKAGGPISVSATVLWAGRKRFAITGPLKTGTTMDLGATAVIDLGGIVVSIVSVQWSAIDLDCFHQFGFDPADFRFVLLRSKTHFRHVYEPLSAEIVIIDTPDWGPADLATLPYRHIPDGVFPVTA